VDRVLVETLIINGLLVSVLTPIAKIVSLFDIEALKPCVDI